MTFPLKIIGNIKSKIAPEFKFTINTALGTGNTFTWPLVSGYTYNFTWTPGDGSPALHVTAYDDVNASYDYGTPFNGQVSATGKIGGFSFNDGGDKLKIISIDNWGTTSKFDYIERMFYRCSNLESFPSGSIDATSNATNLFYFVRDCSSLVLVENNGNIFDKLTGLQFAQQSFQGLTAANNIIPSKLFNLNSALSSLQFAFALSTGMTGNSQSLWLKGDNTLVPPDYDVGSPVGDRCYLSLTGLDDYATIPSYWK